MPNRLKPEIMDGIYEAFERAGGVDYLEALALSDPPTFCRLLARLIPQQINADINTNTIDLGAAFRHAEQRIEQLEHERSHAEG